jgi:acyl-CoA thioesterase FadM
MDAQIRPLLVELPIVVKTYDIDFANIVHNRVYIRWLEDLRQQRLAAASRQMGYFASLATLQPLRIPERLRERWIAAGGV